MLAHIYIAVMAGDSLTCGGSTDPRAANFIYDGGVPTPTLCLFVLLRILCSSSIINAKL
jgi:hypothetical protein